MTEELKSHPDRSLSRHVRDVQEAAAAILALHSRSEDREKIVSDIVSMHDLGKATKGFQEYIGNPSGFKGDKDRKAHTPLGFAATLLLGEELGWSHTRKLQVAAAVLGHHTSFPTAKRMTDAYLMDDKWGDIIETQAEGVPISEANNITGFDLADILSNADICGDAYDVAEAVMDSLAATADQDLGGAVVERLRAQFVFSVLLEADKAFLALSPDGRSGYRRDREARLSPMLVEKYLGESDGSEINALRTAARKEAIETLLAAPDQRLWTLALPTGLGKTLTAASLALSLREGSSISGSGPTKRIILVLPFLSIIDQTAKVYDELLGKPQPSMLMQSHSLSERVYDTEEQRDAEFFLDTWDSEIVVTTFDQFLLSLLGDRARHQMRFHNLADTVLIFDEVQALPTQLWDIVNHALTQLTEHLGSTAILMSATQPGFVEEIDSLIQTPERYYEKFGRYLLVLKHETPTTLEDFIESVLGRRDELESERVLITLNTRSSAREVRNALTEAGWGVPVYFLTADVTPKDRLAAIDRIKDNRDEPCLVVSTQVIEAGVDLDMSLVMRDFAPLDSLIQVAGRCNRNGRWPRKDVEIYHLTNATGRYFAEMVYTVGKGSPDVRLEETRRVLKPYETVTEESVLSICDDYFARLRDGKDLGRRHTRNWASLAEEQPNIRELLRGERTGQVQLIVAERDEGDLAADIEAALEVGDRWERRRALRNLAGRIARVTVSVWVKGDWHPTDVANPLGYYDSTKPLEHPWWIVRPDNYDPKTGLQMEGDRFL